MTAINPTADGNVVSDTDLQNGAVTDYTYNARNELVKSVGPYPDPAGAVSQDFSQASGTTGDWSTTWEDYNSSTTSGDTVTWTFDNLVPGQQYEIEASWQADSGNTANGSYSYTNGGSSISAGTADQQVAPQADFVSGGTTWQGIVTFTATGTSATFTVTAGSSGRTLAPKVQIQQARPVTTYGYDPAGDTTSETSPMGETTSNSFDADGNEVQTTLPDGTNTIDNTFDLAGNPLTTTSPSPTGSGTVTTVNTYDQQNNLETSEDADGNVTSYTHDQLGDTTSLTDSDGNSTLWTFDHDGQQTTQSSVVALGYFPDGTVDTQTATNYDFYDPAGNLTTTIDSDYRSITASFDHLDRETNEVWTDQFGNTVGGVAYTYNNAGETLEASNTVGSSLTSTPVADYTYSYDSVGNVSDVTAKFAGVTDEYDNPVAIQLASAYDFNGNRTTLAANIGGATATLDDNGDFSDFTTGTDDFVNNYSYDPLGEMTKIVQTAQTAPEGYSPTINGVAPKTVTMDYNADGTVADVNRYATDDPDELNSSTLVAAGSYGYDDDSDVTGLTYTDGAGNLVAGYHLDYNSAGLVTTAYSYADTSNTTDRTSTYTTWAKTQYNYDPTAQLSTTGSGESTVNAVTYTNFAHAPQVGGTSDAETYTNDPNGNRTSGSTVSATNRLLFDGTYFYLYDAAGNRVARYQNSVDNGLDSHATDITIYAWNNANELTGATHYTSYANMTADTPVSDWSVTYGLDAFGRVVSRTPVGISGESAENYVYDGENTALVLSSSGQVTERELYAAAVDAIMASEAVSPVDSGPQSAGTVSWMLGDNQGTIRDVAQGVPSGSTMTADVVDHVIFDAYGNASQGAGFTSDPLPQFGFDGMRYDSATGLNIAEYRFYDPRTGNWLGQDPIGFAGGQTNLMEYCGNSPTNFVDPSGLISTNPLNWPGDAVAYVGDSAGDVVQGYSDHLANTVAPTDQHAAGNSPLSAGPGLLDPGQRLYNIGSGPSFEEVRPGWHKVIVGRDWIDQHEMWVRDNPAPVGVRGMCGGSATPVRGYVKVIQKPSLKESVSASVQGGINTFLITSQGAKSAADGAASALEGEAAQLLRQCFPAGTLVATPRGQFPIESLKAGDEVWAYDLVNGRWCPRTILQTFVSDHDGTSAKITVADEAIEATFLHPFWVISGKELADRPIRGDLPRVPEGATTSGRWVDAGDVRVGDLLLLRDGRILPVQAIQHQPYIEKVYNVHVEEFECYAVGQNGVLAHNWNGAALTNIHHQLPRQFAQQFAIVLRGTGMTIEDFTIELDTADHVALHSGPMNWNWQWAQFFEGNPNPTFDEVLDFLSDLRDAFGLR